MDTNRSRSYLWMFPVVLLLAFAVFGIGVHQTISRQEYAVLAAGCVSVFAVLAVWCLALHLQAAAEEEARRQATLIGPLVERLQQLHETVRQIGQQQLLSERAKAVAFRDTERDTLRRAIREDIARRDFDAALALAGEMERVFGYKQEADRFRVEIDGLRNEDVRRQVAEALTSIDRLCRAEQWSGALREAEKAQQQFPADAAVQRLPADIEARRQGHKKQLLDSWNDAVNRHDVDGSIEILKQLDAYLTPQEAESMQESARKVFKDKLQLLGQQFTIAVRDHNWADAVRLGEGITREFPNSRMAQEVREKMDLLRQKVSQAEPAKV